MPIVASMGGNAGMQTLAVTIRTIATNELTENNFSQNDIARSSIVVPCNSSNRLSEPIRRLLPPARIIALAGRKFIKAVNEKRGGGFSTPSFN